MQRSEPFKDIYRLCDTGSSAEKIKNLIPFPRYIDVELTNLCNFSCVMCPIGRGLSARKQGFMSEKLFSKVLFECAANNCHIRFVRWGEPTLHPCLLRFVEQVVSAGLLCHINTNGFFCDDEFISRIIRIPLSSIKFSMQGVDKVSYEAIRRNGNFLGLLTAMQQLYLRRGRRSLPFISVGTTITNEDTESIDKFKRKISQFCDKVTIGKTKDIILPQNPQTNFPECPEVFDKLSIDWDGTITACCSDWNNLMVAGNANEQTLKEIWGGDRMRYFREVLVKKQHNTLPLCSNCRL